MVITRFAPSPTGYLHLGGARTALFAYLFAKKNKGQFLLRIEDTDRERSTETSVQAIFDSLQWLDLRPDEKPVFQTQRFDRYRAVADQLLASDKAYRCYCTKERLEALRQDQLKNKEKPRYDRFCRNLESPSSREPFVVRFKNPESGRVRWIDLVHGEMIFENDELDDLILIRADGTPTYNFTVVVDDADMRITHVLRGDDHINNTPRQINIFSALNSVFPQYGHLPMLLGQDGERLSKRHGSVSVMQYRDEGYLPQALLNGLLRLGWSYGDQEIFSREEMIRYFETRSIQKSPAIFNPEKLLWLNQHYIKTLPAEEVAPHLAWQMRELNINLDQGPNLSDLIQVQSERVKTLKEMAEQSRYFYDLNEVGDSFLAEKFLKKEYSAALACLVKKLNSIPRWEKISLHQILNETVQEMNLKLGMIGPAIRFALTGNSVSPALNLVLYLLGKTKSIDRLEQALIWIHGHSV